MATQAPEKPGVTLPETKPGNLSGWMAGLQEGYQNNPTTEQLPDNVKMPDEMKPAPEKKEEPPPVPATKPEEKKPDAKKVEISEKERTEIRESIKEGKWPRSSDQWEKYKAVAREDADHLAKERDEWKTKAAEFEKKLTTTDPAKPTPEFEAIKKERDELDATLRKVAVAEHPKFKQYYDGKESAQVELAKRIVSPELSDKIATILKMPDSQYRDAQLEEAITDLTPIQQSRLGGVMNSIAELRAERASEIERAREGMSALQEQTKKQSEAQREQLDKLFSTQVSALQDAKNGHPLYQTKQGDDKWNSDVAARIESAKTILTGRNEPALAINHALHAAAYPALLQETLSLTKENNALKAQIEQLTKSSPKLESERTTETNGEGGENGKVEHKSGSRPMEAAAAWVKSLPRR